MFYNVYLLCFDKKTHLHSIKNRRTFVPEKGKNKALSDNKNF